MKRITVEEVKAAFEKIGAKPAIGLFYEATGECRRACAMGALAAANGADTRFLEDEATTNDIAEILEVDRQYADGVAAGFDSGPTPPMLASFMSAEYLAGRADGAAFAAAVGVRS